MRRNNASDALRYADRMKGLKIPLLDAAKRAVEIAIEEDEAAALRFLDAADA